MMDYAPDQKVRADIYAFIDELEKAGLLGRTAPAALPSRPDFWPYLSSWRHYEGGTLFMVRTAGGKLLVTVDLDIPFVGNRESVNGHRVGIHCLSSENAAVLRDFFPFTAPAKLPAGLPSFGTGDRLGLANPGHIRIMRQYKVAPVLAQQSIRELNLTGRSYTQVIDAASWAVLQEGFERGFGADGDHLKAVDEVRLALQAGVSMITLDLSLCLGKNEGLGPCPGELAALAGTAAAFAGVEIRPAPDDIEVFWKIYGRALEFVAEADLLCAGRFGQGRYDLEVSVDETAYTTRPLDHYLLAWELRRRRIKPFSLAPRFPGEFQKGIDYRGDLRLFAADLRIHAAIAREFGYKISIHSGSDKFAIFPLVADLTGGNFHEKTAGTSWLEGVRVVADKDPALFRRIYARARDFFPEAKKHYHIATELTDIAPIDDLPDERLRGLLDQEASRQYLHITYGQILQAPDLGPDFLRTLRREEDAYYAVLQEHFQRHLDGLGIKRL